MVHTEARLESLGIVLPDTVAPKGTCRSVCVSASPSKDTEYEWRACQATIRSPYAQATSCSSVSPCAEPRRDLGIMVSDATHGSSRASSAAAGCPPDRWPRGARPDPGARVRGRAIRGHEPLRHAQGSVGHAVSAPRPFVNSACTADDGRRARVGSGAGRPGQGEEGREAHGLRELHRGLRQAAGHHQRRERLPRSGGGMNPPLTACQGSVNGVWLVAR
jgi:hypothetical protein